MKLTVTLAVLLAIVVVAFIVQNFANRQLLKDAGETKRQLLMKDKQIELKRDSIEDLEQQAEHLRASMVRQVSDARDSLKMEKITSQKWKVNYAKAKASHIDRAIPNDSIEALVSGLIGDN